jgi:hypothetical protein
MSWRKSNLSRAESRGVGKRDGPLKNRPWMIAPVDPGGLKE